jgi:hypothetical protein
VSRSIAPWLMMGDLNGRRTLYEGMVCGWQVAADGRPAVHSERVVPILEYGTPYHFRRRIFTRVNRAWFRLRAIYKPLGRFGRRPHPPTHPPASP